MSGKAIVNELDMHGEVQAQRTQSALRGHEQEETGINVSTCQNPAPLSGPSSQAILCREFYLNPGSKFVCCDSIAIDFVIPACAGVSYGCLSQHLDLTVDRTSLQDAPSSAPGCQVSEDTKGMQHDEIGPFPDFQSAVSPLGSRLPAFQAPGLFVSNAPQTCQM